MHQLVTLKIKQLAIIIEILVICLNPSNEFPTKSLRVNSTKEVVEVLDQNLSPPKINKTRGYESKKKSFKFLWQPSCLGLICKWSLMVLCTL